MFMATIHCMCGYIGFGKTTVAKKLAQQYQAKRFTPDELMIQLYGTDVGQDFMDKAEHLNTYIWQEIDRCLKNGQDVIYDSGSWGPEDRKYVMEMAHKLKADVLWHQIQCNIETAKQRTLTRAQEVKELSIDEKFFDKNLTRYKPIEPEEHLTVVLHQGD